VIKSNKQLRPNLFSHGRVNPVVTVSDVFLEFDVIVESNDLVYENQYSKKQELIYKLIKLLHDEDGLSYRKISVRLNSWGIKTIRGKDWSCSKTHSILKRYNQRQNRINKIRKRKFDIVVENMRLTFK
jgi:hypothetical protein